MSLSYAVPAGVPQPKHFNNPILNAASINAAAALRNYNLNPRLDYGTISAVNGPLVILDNVKVRATTLRLAAPRRARAR
jgi:hypothetical protein